MIELDRYRGGQCNGKFTSRLHYLEDWIYDNERRGLVTNLTRSLGGVPMRGRYLNEMSKYWRDSRYLRNNPRTRPGNAPDRKQDLKPNDLPYSQREKFRKSNREFRMAMSSVSVETVRKVSPNMSDWRIGIARMVSSLHARFEGRTEGYHRRAASQLSLPIQ